MLNKDFKFEQEFEFEKTMSEQEFYNYMKEIEEDALKVTMEKRRENFIPILIEEGYGYVDIANKYYDLIVNDFNVTVDDICNYLVINRSTFNSKSNNYRLQIKHIYINDVARVALMEEDDYINEKLGLIKLKKVLYSNLDFQRFLKDNITVEKSARKISVSLTKKYKDFNINLYEKVFQNIFEIDLIEKPKKVNGELVDNIKKIRTTVNNLPPKLLDYKNIMNICNFKYSTYFYDFVQKNWLDRYVLNGSVRYSAEDLDMNEYIIIPYCFLAGLSDEQLLYMPDKELFEYFLSREYKGFRYYSEKIKQKAVEKKSKKKRSKH